MPTAKQCRWQDMPMVKQCRECYEAKLISLSSGQLLYSLLILAICESLVIQTAGLGMKLYQDMSSQSFLPPCLCSAIMNSLKHYHLGYFHLGWEALYPACDSINKDQQIFVAIQFWLDFSEVHFLKFISLSFNSIIVKTSNIISRIDFYETGTEDVDIGEAMQRTTWTLQTIVVNL
ncbi:hypothetical protein STEG23_023353 [Scotinomys teguina]